MGIREELTDVYGGDLLFADDFDSAIVGVAWEYLEFNTFGAWVGDNTPIYFYAKEVSCEVIRSEEQDS